MSTVKCPKCSYKRQPSDTTPDWQCPSCGIAYAKFTGDFSKVKTVQKVAEPDDGVGNRLIYAFLGGIGGAVMGVVLWVVMWSDHPDDWGSHDLKMKHIVAGSSVLFAVLGFFMKSKVVDLMFDKTDEERAQAQQQEPSKWWNVVAVIMIIAFIIVFGWELMQPQPFR